MEHKECVKVSDNCVIKAHGISDDKMKVVNKKKKRLKRKLNDECEAPIDEKLIKLENGHDNLCENPLENSNEIDENNKGKLLGNEINGKYIRKVLNGAGGIGILRKFVSICNNNERDEGKKDLAGEFLEAKGSILEILRLLDECDKKNSANVATIFSAMQILIMKILTQYPQYLTNAEQVCRHFINSHLSSVHSMFSSQSIPQHRKICLRLLTAIVSLGGNLPRELLGHLSFHSQTLELLCQHTKPSDKNNVRTCFIHFIISFLVDGTIGVIRSLLDKRGMLASIFPGLIYDPPTTVHLVMNTVKNFVLENSHVSKTMKLHLFSTPVVQSLVSLYNWKGPSNWPGMNRKKIKPIAESVDPDDKRIAVEAVHEFLLLLLTSTRHGIVFNDKSMGTSGRKHNQLANSVLQSLDKPWEHEKPRELITKILSSSPDLIKSQLICMEPFMAPRLSIKWIQLMQFIRSIVMGIDYKLILIPNLSELTFSQLISASLTLSMPQIVLKCAIIPAINDSSVVLRHEAIETLTIMLRQMKKILELMKNNSHVDFIKFRSTICDYIVKNSPNLSDLLGAWRKSMNKNHEEIKCDGITQEIIGTPSNTNYYLSIINLLQIYRDICPEYLDEFNINNGENIEPIILLKDLTTIESGEFDEKFNEIKIKVIEFILSINSDAFITNKEYFRDCLLFLISLLNNNNNNNDMAMKLNAIETIKLILISSEVFEGTEDQIEIWINCFELLKDDENIVDVAKWFVKILQRTIKQTDKYSNKIIEAEENNSVDEKMNKNIIDRLYQCFSFDFQDKMTIMQPPHSIPLLFCAAIDNLSNNTNENVTNYLSFVAILTLHCQINPETMINLTANIKAMPNKYLSCWKRECGNCIKKPFDNNNIMRKYSKVLLTNGRVEWENVFGGYAKKLEINYNHQLIIINYSLNNYEILSLLKMTLFYMTQSLRQMKMDNEQFQRYKMSIIILLNMSINGDEEKNIIDEYLRLVFTNPILLQYFSPLSIENNNNPLELMITNEFIYEISKLIIEKIKWKNSQLIEIFTPFKHKFLLQIKLLIDKSMNGWRIIDTINFNKFIEIFQLNSRDIYQLLNNIFQLPNKIILSIDKKYLSPWGEIVPQLIELQLKNADNEKMDKNFSMIKKMINHLSQLLIKTTMNIDNWINGLYKYLQKYPHNIALIDNKIFQTFLQRELTPSLINFIGLLINRNEKFISQFIEYVTKNNSTLIERSELIFPIISSNLSYKWNGAFLNKIYQQYSDDIANYFACQSTQTNNWIDNNLNSTLYLINSTFNTEISEGIIEKILSSGDKLDNININYIKLLGCLVKKCSQLKKNNNSNEPMINFIQILIRIGVNALKKYSVNDSERLKLICEYLCETIENLRLGNNDIILEEVNKNNSWPQFLRFSLKIGLKSWKNTNTENKTPAILKTLAQICSLAYRDNSNNEYIKTIFEMTTTHSEFMDTILLNNLDKKSELLELILALVRKNHSIMTQSHIPLYLSAYNATLNKCDQIILMLLQHYEGEKIEFKDYKPYFWGESAVNYYSIKGEADTALWRQPSTTQIFDLFNIEIVTNTIENYPINRKLNGNKLEIIANDNVYDPAFYLPLITYLLSDNNVVTCNRVTQNGALSLAFAACGSACDDVRIAAFTVLSRFHFHLEATSHKEKLLWMRILDGLKNGLSSPLKDTKISCLVSTFLAKASLVSTQPINPLYSPIQSFFMAKPALDLNTIPEFLTLFHSSEINHKINRHWILQMIRDGIKSEFDVDLALKCVLYRMLFDFYHCILADLTTKNLILEIVNSSTKIPKATLLLIKGYGLIVWLNNVAIKMEDNDIINIKLIINIIRNIIEVMAETNDREHYQYMLLTIVKNLLRKFTKNIDINTLNNYLMSLNNLSHVKLFKQIIEKVDIEWLINLSSKITDINIVECIDILNYGCEFIERHELINNNTASEMNLIKTNLKQLLINWHTHNFHMDNTVMS